MTRGAANDWRRGFSRNLGDLSLPNVFLVELLAVQATVNLITSLDIPQAIIECDSLQVVNMLNG